MEDSARNQTIDALRGLAALAVCWYHYTYCEREWLGHGLIANSGRFGWLGVHVFFVISGFVIPLSLSRARYRVSSYGRFVLKRIVRLDPPYIASMAVTLGIGYYLVAVSNSHDTARPILSVGQVIVHFGYLNAFFHYPWFNPVYWTLALEFQYYLLIGLLFPLVNASRPLAVIGLFLAFTVSALIPDQTLVFHWMPLFLVGICAFLRTTGRLSTTEHLVATGAACLLVYVSFRDWHPVVVGGLASIAICLPHLGNAPLRWLGDTSYSLYLVHYPVGKLILGIAKHYHFGTPVAQLVAIFAALAIALGVAHLLHRWVEIPAQNAASRIRYRHHTSPVVPHLSPSIPEA